MQRITNSKNAVAKYNSQVSVSEAVNVDSTQGCFSHHTESLALEVEERLK